jgi:hypothetical protein
MAKYRVADAHHGRRTAVFDEYNRCVELVPAGMSDTQLAALVTAQDAAGAYQPDRLLAQRTFDSTTQEWADIQWPSED